MGPLAHGLEEGAWALGPWPFIWLIISGILAQPILLVGPEDGEVDYLGVGALPIFRLFFQATPSPSH